MTQGARTITKLRAEVARLKELNRRKQATIKKLRNICDQHTRVDWGMPDQIPHWSAYDTWEDYANAKVRYECGFPPQVKPATTDAPTHSSLGWWRRAGTLVAKRLGVLYDVLTWGPRR